MTDKHPTDALLMPEKSFLGTSRFGSIFYGHTDEALRAYGIVCFNLGRESMREEAEEIAGHYAAMYEATRDAHFRFSKDPFQPSKFGIDMQRVQYSRETKDAIRSIEL